MHGPTGLSFLDTVLLIAPLAVLLMLALFGMDERLSATRSRSGRGPRFCEVGPDGQGLLSDPHGNHGSRGGSQAPGGH